MKSPSRAKLYNQDAWLLTIPAFIPLFFLSIVPLVQAIWTGFTDLQAGYDFKPKFIGIENFRRLIGDTFFWQSFRIGIVWAVSVTTLALFLGFGLALLLNQKLRFLGLMRVLSLIPWAMPPVIVAIMWQILLNPAIGPVDSILRLFNFPFADKYLLGDFETAFPTVVVIGAWVGMPVITVSILAALQGINSEIIESAKIDGANAWNRFRYVTLPAVRSITTALVALNIIWNFNSFGLVFVLTAGGPGGKTYLPALFVYNESFKYGNFGYAAAMGIVMTISVILMLVVYLKARERQDEN
ncbi:MAG: sugar ABC transporter permease [Actinobacteria bacterium]|nr:sugar ABC transporter permease [Actinomycetota bacterium]NCW34679.1 sugar ABC transporter permease [Actinomycetota bacterium]NCZ73168.1 sugar ABC transporter permease [Actinomycetota bacterium]NDA41182.1 sugar ABC transporter permease [Actinomycetota bacterium]NDB31060.1 sugar ABC transporter permease [Actinomycetota bacterium]